MESTQQALAPVRMAMGLMDDTPTARHSSIRDLRISTHPNIAGPLLGGAMLHIASENLTASGCHLTSRKRGGPHSRIDPERLLPSGGGVAVERWKPPRTRESVVVEIQAGSRRASDMRSSKEAKAD